MFKWIPTWTWGFSILFWMVTWFRWFVCDCALTFSDAWAEWGSWSGCSGVCSFSPSTRQRNRTCLTPNTASGLDGCPNEAVQTETCDRDWGSSLCPLCELNFLPYDSYLCSYKYKRDRVFICLSALIGCWRLTSFPKRWRGQPQ